MTLNQTKTMTISVAAPFNAVMADLSDPMNHTKWGTEFFSGPATRVDNGEIHANVPMMGGPVKMKVRANEDHGTVDLFLAPRDGDYGSPLAVRVLRNGDGADILWTLTRFPGVPHEAWENGLQSMQRELDRLKQRLETL